MSVPTKPAGSACLTCPGRDLPCVPAEPATKKARLAIVGEQPGRTEVEQGRPFVGASGRMLEGMLKREGLTRADVHWTNAVLCPVDKEGMADAKKACAARLKAELVASAAPVVVPTGAHALHVVAETSNKPSILKYRGSVIDRRVKTGQQSVRSDSSKLGEGYATLSADRPVAALSCLICPTVHPAFAMRAPQWESVLALDIARAVRLMRRGYVAPEDLLGKSMIVASCREDLERLAELGPTAAFDVETLGLAALITPLVCFGLSDGTLTIVVPWSETLAGTGDYWGIRGLSQARVLSQYVNPCLAKRVTLTHNGPTFDHVVAHQHGIKIEAWDDTLLQAHAIAGHLPKRLGHVVAMCIDAPPWKEEDHDASPEVMFRYNGRDVLYTAMCGPTIARELEPVRHVYEADKHSAILCRNLQFTGLGFDRERALQYDAQLAGTAAALAWRAAEHMGRPVKLLSTHDVGRALFTELGAPVYFRTKTDRPSTGATAMRGYQAHPNPRISGFADLVIEYRRVCKIRSSYVSAHELVHDHGDHFRVHPSWKNYGAVSGRWSASDPNPMNLPRRENDPTTHDACRGAKKPCGDCGIRSVYCARPGYVFVGFDAKQLEMRMAANVTGDENMIRACASSDLHAVNAELIFGAAFTEATGAERDKLRTMAKTSGFAVCYGSAALSVYQKIISMGVPATLRMVERMLANMRKAFSTYYDWQADNLLTVMRTAFVTSPILGRRRWLGFTPDANECMNFPIQAGAADLMNGKLTGYWAGNAETRQASTQHARGIVTACAELGAALVAQVHDAAYFETPEDRADDVAKLCRELFEAPVTLANGREVVFPIDLHIAGRMSAL